MKTVIGRLILLSLVLALFFACATNTQTKETAVNTLVIKDYLDSEIFLAASAELNGLAYSAVELLHAYILSSSEEAGNIQYEVLFKGTEKAVWTNIIYDSYIARANTVTTGSAVLFPANGTEMLGEDALAEAVWYRGTVKSLENLDDGFVTLHYITDVNDSSTWTELSIPLSNLRMAMDLCNCD